MDTTTSSLFFYSPRQGALSYGWGGLQTGKNGSGFASVELLTPSCLPFAFSLVDLARKLLWGGQGGEQQQSKGAEGGLDVGAGSSSPILPGGCEVPAWLCWCFEELTGVPQPRGITTAPSSCPRVSKQMDPSGISPVGTGTSRLFFGDLKGKVVSQYYLGVSVSFP